MERMSRQQLAKGRIYGRRGRSGRKGQKVGAEGKGRRLTDRWQRVVGGVQMATVQDGWGQETRAGDRDKEGWFDGNMKSEKGSRYGAENEGCGGPKALGEQWQMARARRMGPKGKTQGVNHKAHRANCIWRRAVAEEQGLEGGSSG